MLWIINFPSYYAENVFNFEPYCLIDSTPMSCKTDPTTPYQIIVEKSPKIVNPKTSYTITIMRVACPRSLYAHDSFESRYIFIGVLANETSNTYIETALLYPEQNIHSYITGIMIIRDITVTTLTHNSFSAMYAIFDFECNVLIPANSMIFLIFPSNFDNFHNH